MPTRHEDHSLCTMLPVHPHCCAALPQICSRDYVPELKVWIDDADLLEYLGGNSKGTLLDDIGPWSDPSTVAKLGLTMPSMSGESPIKSGLSRMGSEVDDGYATPRWGAGAAHAMGGRCTHVWPDEALEWLHACSRHHWACHTSMQPS